MLATGQWTPYKGDGYARGAFGNPCDDPLAGAEAREPEMAMAKGMALFFKPPA